MVEASEESTEQNVEEDDDSSSSAKSDEEGSAKPKANDEDMLDDILGQLKEDEKKADTSNQNQSKQDIQKAQSVKMQKKIFD